MLFPYAKRPFFRLLAGLGLLAALDLSPLHVAAAAPPGDFEKGVSDYVGAATGQLADIRKAIDSTVAALPEDDRDKYDDVYKKLGICDQLLVELQRSSRQNFDARKKQFEEALRQLISEITKVQEG